MAGPVEGGVEGGSLTRAAAQIAQAAKDLGGPLSRPSAEGRPINERLHDFLTDPAYRGLVVALDRHEVAEKAVSAYREKAPSASLTAWAFSTLTVLTDALGHLLGAVFVRIFSDNRSTTLKNIEEELGKLNPPPFPSAEEALKFCRDSAAEVERLGIIAKFSGDPTVDSQNKTPAIMEAVAKAIQAREKAIKLCWETPFENVGVTAHNNALEDYCLADLQLGRLRGERSTFYDIDSAIQLLETHIKNRGVAGREGIRDESIHGLVSLLLTFRGRPGDKPIYYR